MGSCDECGADVRLPYTCSRCDASLCHTHHLPENHICRAYPSGITIEDESSSGSTNRLLSVLSIPIALVWIVLSTAYSIVWAVVSLLFSPTVWKAVVLLSGALLVSHAVVTIGFEGPPQLDVGGGAGGGMVTDSVNGARTTTQLPTTTQTATKTASTASIDTDRDTLPDDADPDPRRKDVYVTVLYGDEIDPLSSAELSALKAAWADMPVENPDGSEGIDLHISRETRLDYTPNLPDHKDAEWVQREFYTVEYLGDHMCRNHLVVMGTVSDGRAAGIGDAPGYTTFVDGSHYDHDEHPRTFRVDAITHELLHNVVGRIEPVGRDRYHTNDGFLSHTDPYENWYLSNETRDKLNSDGFGHSEYYEEVVCSG